MSKFYQWGSVFASLTNAVLTNQFSSKFIKKTLKFAPERNLPPLQNPNLRAYTKKVKGYNTTAPGTRRVVLFIDEFTNYNDTHIGITTIKLLTAMGYRVDLVKHLESGRTYLSKGLLHKAKNIATANVLTFKDIISDNIKLIGIEPSAILTFREEYPDLVGDDLRDSALALAKNTLTIDEFIAHERDAMKIKQEWFTNAYKEIVFHGHCQQKALSSTQVTLKLLTIPENYKVSEIPSGCCGMAGSFGFEREHYKLSMQIGELVLFPAVRKTDMQTLIVAAGTSCRTQIADGTGRVAMHPVEVLYDALKPEYKTGDILKYALFES